MKESILKPTCLRPGCDRVAFARGLCARCRVAAYRLVKSGAITWAELEAKGKAKPPHITAKQWLLS